MEASTAKLQFCTYTLDSIECNVHGTIDLPAPLKALLSTKPMLRLRRIRQLGTVDTVYSTARTMRYEHCIGVFHLALKMAEKLQRAVRNSPARNVIDITNKDLLCVAVAGLFHDLGHGPFSHNFDNSVLPRVLQNREPAHPSQLTWSHEQMSALLIDHGDIRRILDPYLEDKDYVFIKEAIDTRPREIRDGLTVLANMKYRVARRRNTYRMGGRPYPMSFLYDIVNNKLDGNDVDRWDYIVRDSKQTGAHCIKVQVGVDFNLVTCDRLLGLVAPAEKKLKSSGAGHMPARFDNDKDMTACACGCDYEMRLAYAKKSLSDLSRLGSSRRRLHADVYQHKTNLASERQLADIGVLLDASSMRFPVRGGNTRLCDAILDPDVYLTLNDGILDKIEDHILPDDAPKEEIEAWKQALVLWRNWDARRLYKLVFSFDSSELKRRYTDAPSAMDLKQRLEGYFSAAAMPAEVRDNVAVVVSKMDHGCDDNNPLEQVVVYDHRDEETFSDNISCVRKCDTPTDTSQLVNNSPAELVSEMVHIYCKTPGEMQNQIRGIAEEFDGQLKLGLTARSHNESFHGSCSESRPLSRMSSGGF